MARNPFVSKSFFYFVGNMSSRVLSIVFIPLYAFTVSATELGEFDYIQTISAVAFPIVFLGIWESVLRFLLPESDSERRAILVATINVAVLAAIVISLLCGLCAVVARIASTSSVVALTAMVILQGLAMTWQYYARAFGENRLYVASGVVTSLIYVFTSLVFLAAMDLGVFGMVLAFCLSQFSTFGLIEFRIRAFIRFGVVRANLSDAMSLARFSAPLVVNQIAFWLYDGISKIILVANVGIAANGVFSFANRFSILITAFTYILSMSLAEEAYSLPDISSYVSRFRTLLEPIARLYFSLTLLAIPLVSIIYELAFSQTVYYEASGYTFLLLLHGVFLGLANHFGSAFLITDNTRYIFATTLGGALLSLPISLVLVNELGIWGVLTGRLAGSATLALIRAISASRLTGLGIRWHRSLVLCAIAIGEGIFLCEPQPWFWLATTLIVNLTLVLAISRTDLARAIKRWRI